MATILELVLRGDLHKFDPNLEPRDQEFRCIYLSETLGRWLERELPTLLSNWNLEESPAEQLDALLATYTSGERLLGNRQVKCLTPFRDGVWELKTADTRIFGWFSKKDQFVGVSGNTANSVKTHDLYRGYIGEVVRFRNKLDLDSPKYIQGSDYNAVVSNCHFT